eukprot:m.26626 g.26626  ORF g.26626 m.26626 type:complete len:80 (+) comp29424_c0_seq1:30-269(+)
MATVTPAPELEDKRFISKTFPFVFSVCYHSQNISSQHTNTMCSYYTESLYRQFHQSLGYPFMLLECPSTRRTQLFSFFC